MKNQNREIVCLMGLFPDEYLDEITKNSIGGFQSAANKLQWGIVKGLEDLEENVRIFNSIYVGSYPRLYKKIMIPTFEFKHKNDKIDINIGFNNIFGLKVFSRYFTVKKELDNWASNGSGKEKVLLVYAMTTPFAELAGYVKSTYSDIKVIYIIPDLPMYMNVTMVQQSFIYRTLKKIEEFFFRKSLRKIDGYVLLTDSMKNWFDTKINYTVVEGMIVDDKNVSYNDGLRKKQILYAGGIKCEYGVIDLVKAFSEIEDPEWELILYGDGAAMDTVRGYAERDSRIKVMGFAPNAVVVEHQKEVALLVNPRKDQEMTKYSFPSKTLEYMMSGTPMIGYRLSGIPDEYYDNMFVIEDTEDGMKKALKMVMGLPQDTRNEMGKKARKFVVEQKNAKIQCRKIIDLLEGLKQ